MRQDPATLICRYLTISDELRNLTNPELFHTDTIILPLIVENHACPWKRYLVGRTVSYHKWSAHDTSHTIPIPLARYKFFNLRMINVIVMSAMVYSCCVEYMGEMNLPAIWNWKPTCVDFFVATNPFTRTPTLTHSHSYQLNISSGHIWTHINVQNISVFTTHRAIWLDFLNESRDHLDECRQCSSSHHCTIYA